LRGKHSASAAGRSGRAASLAVSCIEPQEQAAHVCQLHVPGHQLEAAAQGGCSARMFAAAVRRRARNAPGGRHPLRRHLAALPAARRSAFGPGVFIFRWRLPRESGPPDGSEPMPAANPLSTGYPPCGRGHHYRGRAGASGDRRDVPALGLAPWPVAHAARRTPSRSTTLTTSCCRISGAACWRWRQGGREPPRKTSPPARSGGPLFVAAAMRPSAASVCPRTTC
jgi:hypothetical protein